MRVYRVEWPDGAGFYTSTRFDHSLIDFVNDEYVHPTSQNDSAYCLAKMFWWESNPELSDRDQHYAFTSVCSLRRWFYNDDWIQRMHDVGCLLVTYEVVRHTAIVGRTQMTFHKPTAKRLSRAALITVLE